MNYRTLGKTGLRVSEIGFGGEWLERHNEAESLALFRACESVGINIVDCWMADPGVRSKIGLGIKGRREQWIIQGHLGPTWQDGQYVRTREYRQVKIAFEDLLTRLGTDYIDLGMMHFVDQEKELEGLLKSDFLKYTQDLRANGVIRHIGLSTHNPTTGKLAAALDFIEVIMFSINPAFDLMPPTANLDEYFADDLAPKCGTLNPERVEFYRLCEQKGIGLTVMKPYAGGRLFDAKRSPFGVALTPLQCLHYSLTRPAVASVLAGFDTPAHVLEAATYSTATEAEKDYASVLAKARYSSYAGQCTYCGHCQPCPQRIDIAMVNKLYDLATMQQDIPASIREHYRSLAVHADACIGCRDCEERCPFGVQVAERMRQTDTLLGKH